MDILAHMLWTNYGARTANKKLKKENKPTINLTWVSLWGIFPDLFAFGIPFLLSIPTIIMSGITFEKPSSFGIAADLYQYSHSLVIWALVFTVVWVIFKKPRLELLGWLLHILIDIPSHAISFYPTPFLFPLSDYRFAYGIRWSDKWFMIINYSLLAIVTIYFYLNRKKQNNITK